MTASSAYGKKLPGKFETSMIEMILNSWEGVSRYGLIPTAKKLHWPLRRMHTALFGNDVDMGNKMTIEAAVTMTSYNRLALWPRRREN